MSPARLHRPAAAGSGAAAVSPVSVFDVVVVTAAPTFSIGCPARPRRPRPLARAIHDRGDPAGVVHHPKRRSPGLVNDTTPLLGLEGLACRKIELDGEGKPVAHLVTADEQAARCPSCRQMSTSPKEYVTTRPRDLPHGGRPVDLRWRKRRWRCRNPGCVRSSFTESVASVPARHRLTTRLRGSAGAAVADRGATVEQAGRDHDLSWPTVWDAAAGHARRVLSDRLAPVDVLGIDETRRGGADFGAIPIPAAGSWSPTAGMSGSSTSPAGRGCSARSKAAPGRR
jgi:hypothetical protein